MNPLHVLLANGARSNRTIVLSDGEDPRVVAATARARRESIARIILIGNSKSIERQLAQVGAAGLDGITVHEPGASPLRGELDRVFHDQIEKPAGGVNGAPDDGSNPHIFAALMVRMGLADAAVGGAVLPATEFVRTAIRVIGPESETAIIASFFLVLFCQDQHDEKCAFIFADAGLVAHPTATEMAEIARVSAISFLHLTVQKPRLVVLSDPVVGGVSSDDESKGVKAAALLRKTAPDLIVDGAMQFDAAFMTEVARGRVPSSEISGHANVIVFPSCETCDVARKVAQRIGGAVVIGPVLQGLARPANNLPRRCTTEDVVQMIAVTAAQCAPAE